MDIYKIKDGVNLYYLKDEKYKTASVSISIKTELKRENATYCALLAKVLKRGTKNLESIEKINPYLESLYGTRYDVYASKKANIHFLKCGVTTVSNRYTGEKSIEKATELMLDFVYNPYMPQGELCSEYVESEKKNLRDDILASINDKRAYATQRCIDIMCQGENISVHADGYIEDIDGITSKSLTDYYLNLIRHSQADIFLIGSADVQGTLDILKEFYSDKDIITDSTKLVMSNKSAGEERFYPEEMEVNQGKLSIGLRTGINAKDEMYYPLLVGNSIFGSGAHSKLFLNVREKMSLCYYVYSRLDKLSGLMLIGAGIEFDKFQLTKDAIYEQLNGIKEGNFTDEEIQISKNYLINVFNSYKDSQFAMRDYLYTNILCNMDCSLENAIEKVKNVTREEIIKAFAGIRPDTVYFLKGKSTVSDSEE